MNTLIFTLYIQIHTLFMSMNMLDETAMELASLTIGLLACPIVLFTAYSLAQAGLKVEKTLKNALKK